MSKCEECDHWQKVAKWLAIERGNVADFCIMTTGKNFAQFPHYLDREDKCVFYDKGKGRVDDWLEYAKKEIEE